MPVQLNPAASTVLVFFYLVASLLLIGILAGLFFALRKLNEKMEAFEGRLLPLLDKAEQVLTITNEKIGVIGDRTEGILSQGEAVAETVHDRVDRTASAVQKTVHAPLIGLNAWAAGLTRGIDTFSRLQQRERSPGVTAGGTVARRAADSPVQESQDAVVASTRIGVPAGAPFAEKE